MEKYLNTQDNVYLQYWKVSNQVKTLIRKSASFVEKEISNQVKDNLKAFWKYINKKRKHKVKIPSLYKFGNKEELAESEVDEADTLARQFSSVSTVETDGLWNLSSKQLINDCDFDIIFSKDTVMKKLKKLVHNKSPGPDGINSQLLKELSEDIAPSLAVIFQNSYSTGCCPSVWNEANISAIYKKGDKKEP